MHYWVSPTSHPKCAKPSQHLLRSWTPLTWSARYETFWTCFRWLHAKQNRRDRTTRDSHYSDVIMGAVASQITSFSIVYSTVYIRAQIKKKTSTLRVTGLCAGNSPVTGEFPAQMASNTETVSIWRRHHEWWWNEWYNQRVLDRTTQYLRRGSEQILEVLVGWGVWLIVT